MRPTPALLSSLAFGLAAALSLGTAVAVGNALESRSGRHVTRALVAHDLAWATARADGLMVTLTGTAPTEAMRFRATTIAGRIVGAGRVIDEMGVTPPRALTAPRFSLELLRNDDGISMIGLVPADWDADVLAGAAETVAADGNLANMVETADFAIPEGWVTATEYGLVALRLLPRSKISIAADRVQITAISDSPAQKRRFETDLGRAIPPGLTVDMQISAPRPVIAPFTLRFVIDEDGPRFDACAADSDRARNRIVAAARQAGVQGIPACTQGLGAPSPSWAEAAERVIAAIAELGSGSVTISDVDVTLIADPTVAQADFDRVVGELTGRLPDVFSLKATLVPRPQAEGSQGPAQFTATLSPEGLVQLRGRLTDERMRDAADAFARARFGAANVYVAVRLDESLPTGWGARVLAGLSGLAELAAGSVLVEPERVQVRGVTGNQEARAEISRLLSDRLGQGAGFTVDVTYEERLDPARGLPTPEECVAMAKDVLDERQISFAPGRADIQPEAAAILDALAEALTDCVATPMEIGGHTDSQGRAETNLTLSQQRADAVLTALSQRLVDTSEMTSRGYGAAEPIADNGTEDGRVANRRIEVRLIAPDAPDALPGLEPVPADDSRAQLTPMPRPEDDIPELDPEEGEPMGEAGDLLVEDDEAEAEPPAGPDPADLVRGALATPEPSESEAESGAAPDAGADQPAPDEVPTITLPAPAATDAPDAVPAAPATATATGEAAEPAPADEPGAEPSDGAEPAALPWQDNPDHPALRPLRRPEE